MKTLFKHKLTIEASVSGFAWAKLAEFVFFAEVEQADRLALILNTFFSHGPSLLITIERVQEDGELSSFEISDAAAIVDAASAP